MKSHANCREFGLSDILFKRDYLQVIQAMNSYGYLDDELSSILFDIFFLMQQVRGWQVIYTN